MQEDNSNSNDDKPNANKPQPPSVFEFVYNNDITAVRQWLINREDESDGWSALHEAAARADRRECLEL